MPQPCQTLTAHAASTLPQGTVARVPVDFSIGCNKLDTPPPKKGQTNSPPTLRPAAAKEACRARGSLAALLPQPVAAAPPPPCGAAPAAASHPGAPSASAASGTAQHSTAQHGTARHGTARHGTARHGMARHGIARQGEAVRTTTWQGWRQQQGKLVRQHVCRTSSWVLFRHCQADECVSGPRGLKHATGTVRVHAGSVLSAALRHGPISHSSATHVVEVRVLPLFKSLQLLVCQVSILARLQQMQRKHGSNRGNTGQRPCHNRGAGSAIAGLVCLHQRELHATHMQHAGQTVP
jgi:hypothetical protein